MRKIAALMFLLLLPACPRPTIMCMILEEYDPSNGACRRISEGPRIWHPIDAVVSGDSLYVFGSYGAMRYDMKDGSWNPLKGAPEFGSVEVRAFDVGGKLVVLGELEVQIFDPATSEWKLGARLPSKRWYFGAALLGNKIYVAGGDTAEDVTADLVVYDPAKDQWTELKPMKRPRTNLVLEASGGLLIAAGGQYHAKRGSVPVRDVECYDPVSDSWIDFGDVDLGNPWKRPASAAIDGRIFILRQEGRASDRAVLVYDPAAKTWSEKPADMLIRRNGCAAAACRGKILVLGGFTNDYTVEDTPDGEGRTVFR